LQEKQNKQQIPSQILRVAWYAKEERKEKGCRFRSYIVDFSQVGQLRTNAGSVGSRPCSYLHQQKGMSGYGSYQLVSLLGPEQAGQYV
jgi:hypothetical protein